jgi:hypothetical protein
MKLFTYEVHAINVAEHKVTIKKCVVAIGLISSITVQGEVAVWIGVATNLYWLFKL